MDELAATAAGHATKHARPSDSTFGATRLRRPRSDPETKRWLPDSCAYCKFRQVRPSHLPAGDDDWWYGTGDGAHNPYACDAFKRYLAEGGDVADHPNYVSHLRKCIRIVPARPSSY